MRNVWVSGFSLLFAAAMTTYMALAVRFEERDLVEHFGPLYEDYRRRVPMVVPRLSRGGSAADALQGQDC
jgi:protein-S-isoprenylcysteine O-methyltransferase Ste14